MKKEIRSRYSQSLLIHDSDSDSSDSDSDTEEEDSETSG